MNNEQIKNTEGEEKIFNSKDLENKSHEEQILHLDGAISHLSLLSEDVENSVVQSELERSGKKEVVGQSSLFDRAGLGINKFLRRHKGYDEKLSEMARKTTDKSLDNLEKGLGSDLLEAKRKLTDHEATANNDLDAVKNLISPEEFSLMEIKMSQEKELLIADKDQKGAELQEKISEYPAGQKYEKIGSLLGEYENIESAINDKRLFLENDIKTYESAFKNIKGTGETSQEIKGKLKEKMEILNKQHEEIKNREKDVKGRMEVLKNNQKELNPYVKRLQTIGKTKAEIIEESKAQLKNNGQNPEKQKAEDNVTSKNNKKNAQPKNNEKEEDNKLEAVIKTPAQWANYIKNGDKDLALSIKVNLVTAFNKQFKDKKDINGLEATSFLASLLKNNNITGSEEKAKRLIETSAN
jgi:hypothetical protein